jgi:hypothetical protein
MLPDALRQRITAPSSIGVVPFAYGSSLIMQHPLLDSLRALLLTVPLAPDHDYSAVPLAPPSTDPEPAYPHPQPSGDGTDSPPLLGLLTVRYRLNVNWEG